MMAYYFTFGCGHPLADYVQRVDASSSDGARATMREFYGDKWAFPYGENEVEPCGEGYVYIHGFRYRVLEKTLKEGETL